MWGCGKNCPWAGGITQDDFDDTESTIPDMYDDDNFRTSFETLPCSGATCWYGFEHEGDCVQFYSKPSWDSEFTLVSYITTFWIVAICGCCAALCTGISSERFDMCKEHMKYPSAEENEERGVMEEPGIVKLTRSLSDLSSFFFSQGVITTTAQPSPVDEIVVTTQNLSPASIKMASKGTTI